MLATQADLAWGFVQGGFLVGLIWLVAWLIRRVRQGPQPPAKTS